MTISVLGCGWLGLPLAERLLKEGYKIKGSATEQPKLQELNKKGIDPFLINLSPSLNEDADPDFFQSDVLVLNIPPGRSRDDVEAHHLQQIEEIIQQLRRSTVKFLVFVSSTSVFPPNGGLMAEENAIYGKATRSSGNALIKAEKLLQKQSDFSTTVLRFGGLYGYDRHPAKFLSGKRNVKKGNAPINLIHRDDCVEIICRILKRKMTDEVFNAVSDGHPPRSHYYTAAARYYGVEVPDFAPDPETDYKIVSNKKLKAMLNYRFKYPNPMDFKAFEA